MHYCECFRSRLSDLVIFTGSENTFSTEPKQTHLYNDEQFTPVLRKIDAKTMQGSYKNLIYFSKKASEEVTRTLFGFQ